MATDQEKGLALLRSLAADHENDRHSGDHAWRRCRVCLARESLDHKGVSEQLRALLAEYDRADATRETLRQLVEQWRKEAQKYRDRQHFRDDPYDDTGHECGVKSRLIDMLADELSALLASLDAAPAQEERRK
jgi:hypothetical protein